MRHSPSLPPDFPINKIAAIWEVDQRTILRWRHKWGDAVVLDEQSVAKKLLDDTRTHQSLRDRARAKIAPDPATILDAGVMAIEAINDLPTLAHRTERHLAEVDAELSRCRRTSDKRGEVAQTKLFREFTASLVSIRRTQMLLGQDSGDLIAKSTALQFIHAWSSRAALGIQRARDLLAPRVLNLKTESEAAAAIDDILIGELYLGPFEAALNTASGCAMPEWFVNAIVKAVSETISGGEHKLKGTNER